MQSSLRRAIETPDRGILLSRHLPGVVTFNRRQFNDACADLMGAVLRDGRPDALIGIRTGGLVVADAMAHAAAGRLAVLALTCRRPSTPGKTRVGYLRKMMAQLPRAVLDELRVIEHAWLTRHAKKGRRRQVFLDANELATLDSWLSRAGPQPDLVIVDDAVDSGATLDCVLDAVRQRVGSGTRLRTAAITVTTEHPIVRPHYALFDKTLCRFPWSLDAVIE